MKKENSETKEKKKHKFLKRFLWIGLPILVLIALIVPTKKYIEVPGTTEPVNQMITVDGKKDTGKGNFYLTTVQIAQANLAMIIYSHFNSFSTIYSAEDLMGSMNSTQYDLVNQFYMQTAQNTAVYQAFKQAKMPYELKYDGVYVLDIAKNSTFKNKLQIADTVTEVNGKTFKSNAEMMKYIQSQKVGGDVNIKVTRIDGKDYSFDGKFVKISTGKTGIGISLVDHTEVVSTPKVKIDAGSIGGPSAGMMFTLEIYNQITGKDLRNGREIAGTGTIEPDGTIGQIGGVDKKIATASKEGAEIFLVPDSGSKKADDNNYLAAKEAAKKLKTSMKIIPVKALDDAITYLETGKVND